jgi:Cu(I)/Ag(I) efflux system membrane fusion protein
VAPSARPEAKREGRVRSKSAVAQVRGAGPAFEARIELTEPFADLLPGMKARATLKGAELKGVVLVPSPAIVTSDKKPTVQVSKDGKASAREVVVGRTDGRLTEIRGGLEAGEKVVLPK